jgi:hypothetical protein
MSKNRESNVMAAAGAGECPNCRAPRPDLSTACPACGAPPLGPAEPGRPAAGAPARTGSITDALMQVRATDIEPYIGLRYLSKLFKFMALLLIVAMLAEIALGFREQGTAAIPTLLGVTTKLLGLAGLLWGAGDLAILMIDIGHDVRAARILIGRQAAHHIVEHHAEPHQRAGERAPRA